MQLKPGTIGFAKLDTDWLKCVVQGQAGATLAVRIAPLFDEKLIHREQFLPENKFRALGFTSQYKFPLRHNIRHKIEYKMDTFKRKLSQRRGRNQLQSERIHFTGSIGWAKICSKGRFFWRKRWQRCLVLDQEHTNLTLCCSPTLSIAKVHINDFLMDDSELGIQIKKYEPHW